MRRTKRKWRFKLRPGSFLLLVPVIVLIIIIANKVNIYTPEPKESEVAKVEAERIVAATSTPKELVLVDVKQDPLPIGRYADIKMSESELKEMAEIIYHEARGESAEGQQAVAEVIFNRVIADNFPNTVHEVIHEGTGTKVLQFSTVKLIGTAEPMQEQYMAIEAALYKESILPADVVFFSRKGENNRVWGSIGNHVFCYQYVWE